LTSAVPLNSASTFVKNTFDEEMDCQQIRDVFETEPSERDRSCSSRRNLAVTYLDAFDPKKSEVGAKAHNRQGALRELP